LLELRSEGVPDVARELRSSKEDPMPLLVFARDRIEGASDMDPLEHAADSDLVSFVDRQR
jgi:hypothetical protein